MDRKGFTLLELIIVMGILAALSVVAIPQISHYNNDQSLQSAAADLQQSLRTAQSNALNGVVCSDNPSNLASSQWSLVLSDTSYTAQATCTAPTPSPWPVAASSTKNLPADVQISGIWIDNTACGSVFGKGISFSNISGNVNFNVTPDCEVISSTQKMRIGLVLKDDPNKKIYVVIERGGSIYVSSGVP